MLIGELGEEQKEITKIRRLLYEHLETYIILSSKPNIHTIFIKASPGLYKYGASPKIVDEMVRKYLKANKLGEIVPGINIVENFAVPGNGKNFKVGNISIEPDT